jgi:hypothetical protein
MTDHDSRENITRRSESSATAEMPGETLTGHLAGLDDEGRVLFRAAGSEETMPVAIGLAMGDGEVAKAAWLGRRALVVVTSGPVRQPVLVGFVRERVQASVRDAAPDELQVQVDGEVVRLRGKQRIELVCGKARLVLDADGRVELNGSYLVQRSRGPVKIKGTTIDLN